MTLKMKFRQMPLGVEEDPPEEYQRLYKDIDQQPKDVLVSMVESRDLPADLRLAAGEVLAHRGDPRISFDCPLMVDIPAARVRVGLAEEEVESTFQECRSFGVSRDMIELESPQVELEVQSFRVAKYCVTNQEYQRFLSETGHDESPSSWEAGRFDPVKGNHPVYSVSFESAAAYCRWLSERTQRRFRLPSEIEWEYVSGGLEHKKYPWGNFFEADRANTIESMMMSTTPVGMFARGLSPFGIFDMAGNVEEHTTSYFQRWNDSSLTNDDVLKLFEGQRVVRGGSFARFNDLTRNTSRHVTNQHEKYVIGFRLVEEFRLH